MTKTSTKTDSQDRGRFSARRKTEAVLRLLRGEDLDTLSRELGVTAATLSAWRDALPRRRHRRHEEPTGRRPGRAGRPPPGQGRPAHHGQRAAGAEVPAPGERPPFCLEEAERLARSASPGTGRPYGLQRVCRIFGLARSTAYYLKAREAVPPEQRPVPRKRGPVGAATDEELVGHIRRVLAESPFHGEGYRKVWARLRHRGIRTASERVRRLMREHHLQAPRRGGNAHGPKAHDGTITTEEPDAMWGTDMTTTVTTGEGLAHVFVAVDHCTCECVGLHAAKRRQPLRGPGAAAAGRAGALRRVRGEGRRGPGHPPRPRQQLPQRRLPAGAEVPGHGQLAELRAGARGERLCRAVHPHPEGAAPVGADASPRWPSWSRRCGSSSGRTTSGG